MICQYDKMPAAYFTQKIIVKVDKEFKRSEPHSVMKDEY